MDPLDAVSARLRPATDVEKFRLAKQEQQREEIQTEGSPNQSSEASTYHSRTINEVKEICERLENHTNELVDLVEDLMQSTEKGDKDVTWEIVQPAVEALHWLPHTNKHVNTLLIDKMTFVDVEDYLGLEYQNPLSGSSWEEPLPHIELPQCAYQMLDIINRSTRRCVKSEVLIRCRTNILLFAVLDAVMMSAPKDAQPLNLQTETHLISRPFQAKRKYWQAHGHCDYTVRYGEEVHEQAINLVIVETKRLGSVSLSEGQALGYMAVVHQKRKASKRARNSTVYGVATDGKTFYFLCINEASKWGRIVLDTAQLDRVVDLLAFMMREAMTVSPYTSRHTSNHASMEDDLVVLG
ncbi:hypothetical protein N7465_002351 [Penicillium sp. CMV-2018d]|nr:hypothetical protein N7465_002351 [Penicillium sp. CMV-2018d]